MDKLRSLSKKELLQVLEKVVGSSATSEPGIRAVLETTLTGLNKTAKLRKRKRPFDMSKYTQRKVALHVGYFGQKYSGLASQENMDDTIEHHLFHALKKVCLISDRQSCNYSR